MSELNAIMKGKDNRKHTSGKKEDVAEGEEGGNDDSSAEKSDYDYLLGMNLWSLTFEKVEEIKKQLAAKTEELKEMQKTTIEQFWDADLNALSATLDELDAQDEADAAAARDYTEGRKRKTAGMRGRAPAPAAPVRKKTFAKEEGKM